MAKKRPTPGPLEVLLAAGDLRGARAEVERLAATPEGAADEAVRGARARFGPERGAAIAAAVGALVLAAAALLGLRHP